MATKNSSKFKKGISGNPKGRPKKQQKQKVRSDSWTSLLTGLGRTGYDKQTSVTFSSDVVPYQSALELWRGDDLAARMVETIPKECLREGFDIIIPGMKDLADTFEGQLEDLDVLNSLETVMQYQRAYGGGALLLGINDGGDLEQPVNWDSIKSLDFISVLDTQECRPYAWYNDPRTQSFGKVALYDVTPVTVGPSDESESLDNSMFRVHASRVLRFFGKRFSK
jgi:hypothetical protein